MAVLGKCFENNLNFMGVYSYAVDIQSHTELFLNRLINYFFVDLLVEKKPEILSWKSVNFTKKYINIGLCKHISQQKQLLDVTNGDCKISHIFTQLTSFKLI